MAHLSAAEVCFLEQLRGALADAGLQARGAGGSAAAAHASAIRELATVLRHVPQEMVVRPEYYPALLTDPAGGFLLAVCGFEEAAPSPSGLPTYRLAQGGVRGVVLARDVVTGYIAAFEEEVLIPNLAVTPPPSPPKPVLDDNVVAVRLPDIPLMPGDQIRVEIPGGRLLDVVVPEGACPGQTINVTYPRDVKAPSDARDERRNETSQGVINTRAEHQRSNHVEGNSAPSIDFSLTADQMNARSSSPDSMHRKGVDEQSRRQAMDEAKKIIADAVAVAISALNSGASASATGKVEPTRAKTPSTSEREEMQLAAALEASLQQEQIRHDHRSGQVLAHDKMLELGVQFERQADGSDTCAIHSLNNICQRYPSQEEVAAMEAAAVAAASARDGERFELGGLALSGLFTLKDLQEAEREVLQEEQGSGFLPPAPTVSNLSALRANSFMPGSSVSPSHKGGPRTGMFDVQTVKVAAQCKGFEVIDIEPTPQWDHSEAAQYATASRNLHASGKSNRWFLGFLVYERIPGRPMHYYVLMHWPAKDHGAEGSWLLLDSLDRDFKDSRNRMMTLEQVKEHYDKNGEWFKSWLVRWYPVVSRSAAITTLKRAIHEHILQACPGTEYFKEPLGLSEERVEEALDGEEARWNVARAIEKLLDCVKLVERELKVQRLSMSEQQARNELERQDWDLERAIKSRAENLLKQWQTEPTYRSLDASCTDPTADMSPQDLLRSLQALYIALHLTNWEVEASARLLLLTSRNEGDSSATAAEPHQLQAADLPKKLQENIKVLEASEWDVDKGLCILTLMKDASKSGAGSSSSSAGSKLAETDCMQVLECVDFDLQKAKSLLEVRRTNSSVPLGISAEALKRSHWHAVSAGEMIKEYQTRLCNIVKRVGAPLPPSDAEPGHSGEVPVCIKGEEVAEVAQLALDAVDWNPAVAFLTAESFALGVVQVRQELKRAENTAREAAMKTIQTEGSGTTEAQVAAAFGVLDTLERMAKQKGPRASDILAALNETDMDPSAAAAKLMPSGALGLTPSQKPPPLPGQKQVPTPIGAAPGPQTSARGASKTPEPSPEPQRKPAKLARMGFPGRSSAGMKYAEGGTKEEKKRGKREVFKEECSVM